MRIKSSLAAVAPLFLAAAALWGQTTSSENTLRLGADGVSPPASVADVAWLAGYWRGEGMGGTLEELWSPPAGDRMQGIFTLAREGAPVFSEAMQLVEEDGTLVLRVKHFTPGFIGWEEKEKFIRFRLVKLAENEAYFSGLTFRRKGDELLIYIVLTSGEKKTEHELRFERVPL